MPRAYGFRHAARDFYTSLRFGATGSVAITSTAQFATAPYTLSAWVWIDTFGSSQTILGSAIANTPVFAINNTGQLTLSLSGGATIATSIGVIQLREWAHVAVRYDAGATRFFINGEDSGSSNTSGSFVQPSTMNCSLSAGSAICEISIHSSALTQSEIREIFYTGNFNNPVMRFRCNDAVGNILLDTVGNSSATITNASFAPWLVPTQPRMTPRNMGSISLSSSTDFVSFSSGVYSSRFNGSSRILMAGWVKPRATGIIIAARSGTVRGYLQSGFVDTFGVFRSQDADSAQGSAANRHFLTTPRQWHFAATLVDFENDTITNFINGVAFDRQTVNFGSNILNISASDLRIGQDPNGTGFMTGLIGPVYLCGGAINRDMVRDLYLHGNLPSVDRVAAWEMTDRSSNILAQTGNLPNMGATLAGSAAYNLESPL